ncbi:odorant receptor 46a-like [Zophobas morio]|uniref:odorant receptor 46a-like n=1 Tax=Zophobas morio TaxID=2755281 RepID=UPI0030835E81
MYKFIKNVMCQGSEGYLPTLNSDDDLHTLYFLSIKIFEHKLFVVMNSVFLAVYATALLANTYFFFKEFNTEFFNQYISVYMGVVAFIIIFFHDYCHLYVFEALYLLSYPITGYMFVRLAYALLYFVSHLKFEVYKILDIMEHVSVEYDYQSDNELLECDEYQKIVKARLLLVITKLTQLARIADLASMITAQLLPPFTISAVLMGLSIMNLFFIRNILGYWSYLQVFLWSIGSASTLIMYAHCGQEFENNTEKVFDAIYNTRWTSFNKSNRKTILTTMIIFQEPKSLRFTDALSCNYELGVRISKAIYSFAAIMARLSNSQEIR